MQQKDLFYPKIKHPQGCRTFPSKTIPATGSAFGQVRTVPLGTLDVILMRKDPPFDMEYVYTTYLLENAEKMVVWL